MATCERLVFDIMGEMWGQVTGNFFNVAFLVLAAIVLFERRTRLILCVSSKRKEHPKAPAQV